MQNIMEETSRVHTEVVVVGTAAVRMPEHITARWVQFTHEHASAKVYLGGQDVTIANGFGALTLDDTTERYPVQNTDIFYAISDTDGVNFKMMWGE